MISKNQSHGHTTDNQRREIEQVASRAGWMITEIYEAAGIMGILKTARLHGVGTSVVQRIKQEAIK